MLKIRKEGIILSPRENSYESRAVLNPAVFQDGNNVHIIYRAIDENYLSTLGYARLAGPLEIAERWEKPFMSPKLKTEKLGMEDPRIVKIDNSFYMTYVAHDGKNAITALASGEDLFKLGRNYVISPQIPYHEAGNIFTYSKLKDEYYFFESFYSEHSEKGILIWHKDCVPFPEKINGRFWMLHRIFPDIQLISFDDFSQLADKYFWLHHLFHLSENVLMESEQGFEARHIGGGAPPVRTDAGWLVIYHAAQEFNSKRIYSAGAALLDLEDPRKVIARLPYPLFKPEENYELEGTVNDVVFPTGTAQFEGMLYIYYGAADQHIAAASVGLDDLLDELLKNKK
jgi:beta-1,2-mannobiose phosphorylase / 1,2-beta-oligomannan phosphorylase